MLGRPRRSADARFDEKYVVLPNGCWEWTGAIDSNGYGRFWNDGPSYAHRVAWVRWKGPLPPGVDIHHRCHRKNCVNVDHMTTLSISDHAKETRRHAAQQAKEAT